MKLGIRPSEWIDLDPQEKAFIIACVDLRCKAEKREMEKVKNND